MAIIHSEEPELFWTTDIGLAAAILVAYPLAKIDARDSSKVGFAFVKTSELGDYIKRFWDKGLLLEPQAFYGELLMLRKRINQEINN